MTPSDDAGPPGPFLETANIWREIEAENHMALFIISSLIPGDRQFVTSILTLGSDAAALSMGPQT